MQRVGMSQARIARWQSCLALYLPVFLSQPETGMSKGEAEPTHPAEQGILHQVIVQRSWELGSHWLLG